jgi:hypothetical protein
VGEWRGVEGSGGVEGRGGVEWGGGSGVEESVHNSIQSSDSLQ